VDAIVEETGETTRTSISYSIAAEEASQCHAFTHGHLITFDQKLFRVAEDAVHVLHASKDNYFEVRGRVRAIGVRAENDTSSLLRPRSCFACAAL
jgi:hypothetical protein